MTGGANSFTKIMSKDFWILWRISGFVFEISRLFSGFWVFLTNSGIFFGILGLSWGFFQNNFWDIEIFGDFGCFQLYFSISSKIFSSCFNRRLVPLTNVIWTPFLLDFWLCFSLIYRNVWKKIPDVLIRN